MKVQDAINLMGSHLNMLPIESGMTLPIPAMEAGHVLLRRFIYITRLVPGEGRYLAPPEMVATVDLTAEKFVSVTRLAPEPSTASQSTPQDWICEPPKFESPEAILTTYRKLYGLLDELLAAFVAKRQATARDIAAAREYHALYLFLREQPLEPFYRRQGREFFEWIDKLLK